MPAVINGREHHAEIAQSPVEPVNDILSVAAVDMQMYKRILLLHPVCGTRRKLDRIGFTGTEIHIACKRFVTCRDIVFRPADKLQNLLGALAEKHALLGQLDFVLAADKQRLAELCLKIMQLTGKRRLRQVERFGSGRDVCSRTTARK